MQAFRVFALRAIRYGFFIIPFIPLFVFQGLFFPFITSKAFVFRIIIGITTALWGILALLYKEYRPRWNLITVSLCVFMGISTLASVFGVNPFQSFWSNFERMEGLITHIHLAAFFVVLLHIFKKEDWFVFFNLYVVAGFLQGFYALSQRFGYIASPQGGVRVDGTLGNPTYLAAYLIFVVAFSILLLLQKNSERIRAIYRVALPLCIIYLLFFINGGALQNGEIFSGNIVLIFALLFFIGMFILSFLCAANSRVWKYLYACSILFALTNIYFTATRGAVLALFIGAICFCVLYLAVPYRKKGNPEKKKHIWMALVGIGLAIIVPTIFVAAKESSFVSGSEVLKRLTTVSLSEGGIASRFAIWKIGLRGFAERPILGWGLENYNVVFSKHFNPSLYNQEPWFDRAHNIIIDWLINAGILGLLAYLALFGATFSMLYRWYRQKIRDGENTYGDFIFFICIVSLGVVYVFQNMFVFDQLVTYISFFTFMAYIAFLQSGLQKENAPSIPQKTVPSMGVTGVVLSFIVVFIFLHGRPVLANKAVVEGLLALQGGRIDIALDRYAKSIAYNTVGRTEAREQMGQATLAVFSSPSIDAQVKQMVQKAVVPELQKNVEENSLDPRSYMLLGTVYLRAGLLNESAAVFSGAVALAPKKQQLYFGLGDVYLSGGDSVSAIETFKKAFLLDTGYDEARINLATAYIITRDYFSADELLRERFLSVTPPVRSIEQAYLIVKDYQRLIGVREAFVSQNPQNVDYRVQLALAYVLSGQSGQSISVLKKAIIDNPDFKERGEALIQEIIQGNIAP